MCRKRRRLVETKCRRDLELQFRHRIVGYHGAVMIAIQSYVLNGTTFQNIWSDDSTGPQTVVSSGHNDFLQVALNCDNFACLHIRFAPNRLSTVFVYTHSYSRYIFFTGSFRSNIIP
ncbi:unnamed protein product [Ceratitis capitata]|uniref:(Mediterranean fruit fly) hypothetical protein n=1 Tax=Ceratitis capitata TaxID=7213 RepID=A0A811U3K9_CERCA|nr:unnamed protein product [Ceratitis capitata]